MKYLIFANNFVFSLTIIGFVFANPIKSFSQGGKKMETTVKLQITSSAFDHNGMIPKKYTCDGEDISPQLSWSGAPEGTKSFALINDDPDAPMGTWVHWVLYDLPPSINELSENMPKDKTLSNGAKQGITDFKNIGYGGPCPPSGIHRYFFKLYALDTKLNLESGATKKQVEDAMKGHVIAQTELIGKYKRG